MKDFKEHIDMESNLTYKGNNIFECWKNNCINTFTFK